MGAKRNSEKVGSCKWSHITVFSFHPVKIITTAEGGIATTNSITIYRKLKKFRTHGIVRYKNFKKNNLKFYDQKDLGFNYRMNELQAALGISQLNKLNNFVSQRNQIANLYDKLLNITPIKVLKKLEANYPSYHLYVIRFKNYKITSKVFNYLNDKNIGVSSHYFPIHLHSYYRKLGFKKGDFPDSEKHAKTSISIPIFPGLSLSDQMMIIKKINIAIKNIV